MVNTGRIRIRVIAKSLSRIRIFVGFQEVYTYFEDIKLNSQGN